jgi:hypothetical protein
MTMDDRTRAALEASIEHWEENAAAQRYWDTDLSSEGCALCVLFRGEWDSPDECSGCPIAEATGQITCKGTPYDAASDAKDAWFDGADKEQRDAFRTAARAEVDFLKSLLPPKEQP